MSCGNGMGLSLNRYSKLTGKYYLDESTLQRRPFPPSEKAAPLFATPGA